MFDEVYVMHCVAVNEGQAAMTDSAGSVAHVEGMLFIAIWGDRCGPDGLECTTEGMGGANEMFLVQVQG